MVPHLKGQDQGKETSLINPVSVHEERKVPSCSASVQKHHESEECLRLAVVGVGLKFTASSAACPLGGLAKVARP